MEELCRMCLKCYGHPTTQQPKVPSWKNSPLTWWNVKWWSGSSFACEDRFRALCLPLPFMRFLEHESRSTGLIFNKSRSTKTLYVRKLDDHLSSSNSSQRNKRLTPAASGVEILVISCGCILSSGDRHNQDSELQRSSQLQRLPDCICLFKWRRHCFWSSESPRFLGRHGLETTELISSNKS